MSNRHYYKRRVVVSAVKKKGFREFTGGPHSVFVLLNEKGQDTNIKTSIINPHKGPSGDVKKNQVKNMATDIGLGDHLDFWYEYIECKYKHDDLLEKLLQIHHLEHL